MSALSRASAEMQGGPLYPISEVSALVGREDAERELVSRLLDGTEENLSVISLVSEEAVGKTALARHVHFHEEFAYKDLLLIILKQIPICLLKDIEQEGATSLVGFPDFNELTEEESWVLFLKNVGSCRSPENSSDLNNFRGGILGICQGLPPAILLLGGLLSTIELSNWSGVIDRSQFGEDKSALLNTVALMSYNELPSALKPCFLHLALFPKAYEIPKRRLLQLWLAEGFVQLSPDEASVPIEDEAKIYLEELPKAEEEGFLHVYHCRSECTSADSEIFKVQRLADQFGVSKSHIGNLLWLKNKVHPIVKLVRCLKKIIKGRDRVLPKYTNITTLPSSTGKAKKLRHLYMNEVSIQKPSIV
ncbi:disease resistance protein rpp13 [Quercus suber]|uniref:Disease resistance protein rpp13 n=1 Tax=Quercus suber TaxID=58331 RepID=A0AAW0LP77_QUESU